MGYEIDASAYIGRALILVDRLQMGAGSWIGDGTVIRGCELVILEEDAAIGSLNFVNAVDRSAPYFADQRRHPSLIMRRGARISALHFIDCTDQLELGELATISGTQSQILTHSFRLETGRQHCAPVRFGKYSLLATNCVVLPGVTVAPYAVVGAMSLVERDLGERHALYVGRPAEKKRDLDPSLGYFTRTEGDMP
jgi:carbonic anhydrase/acetyltransferase-like protein (isoleucine patch superfamily)